MIKITNDTDIKWDIDIKLLENISKNLTKKDIEVVLISDKKIQDINYKYRDINKATDVLSFAYKDIPIAGTIYICLDLMIKNSKKFSHNMTDELCLMFVHGVLHLIGYDHEVDKGEFREKEMELIDQFGLPKSLISRSDI